MTFEEAASDPRRPLALTPREWMCSVEATLAEQEDLVEDASRRIASQKPKEEEGEIPKRSGTGLEKIDMGIDQMVQAVQIVQSGLQEARQADLLPLERRCVEKIKDLIETAIEPYLVDIIKASDELEGK